MSLDLDELVDLAYEEGKTPPKEVIRRKALPIFMRNRNNVFEKITGTLYGISI